MIGAGTANYRLASLCSTRPNLARQCRHRIGACNTSDSGDSSPPAAAAAAAAGNFEDDNVEAEALLTSHRSLGRQDTAAAAAAPFLREVASSQCQLRPLRGPSWAAVAPTWNPSTQKHLNHLMDLFTLADQDGNGILDREEIRCLLQSDGRCTSGICYAAQHQWVTEADLDEIMALYDTSGRGGLTFNEFMELVLDGVLLDGALDEYRAVFASADADGDGLLDLSEMTEVLQQLGGPISAADVEQVMREGDLDGNAHINFDEWLRLFQHHLLDLPRLLRYMKMKPVVLGEEVPPAAAMRRSLTSGGLTLVSGEAQLTAAMEGLPADTLLVLMCGLSGNAMCTACADAVRELAAVYHRAVFLQIHVDTCPENKRLFKHVLLGRYVPAFFFFKNSQLLHSCAHTSVAALEEAVREHLGPDEQPLMPVFHEARDQQQQQQLVQVSLTSSSADVLTPECATGTATHRIAAFSQQVGAGVGFSMADFVYNPDGLESHPSRGWHP